MLRVAGTYRAYGSEYDEQKSDLFSWTAEILDAMYVNTASSNTTLFHNYVDQNSTFLDASSTAAIAAATYHLAVLCDGEEPYYDRLSNAERARNELSSEGHIDGDGWLSPVVDPYDFPKEGFHSAEAQAFVVSMYAGYRDWQSTSEPDTAELGTSQPDTSQPDNSQPGTSQLGNSEPGTSELGASSASRASVSTGEIAALVALTCTLGSVLVLLGTV